MDANVRNPTVSVLNFGDPVSQSWFQQKIATEMGPEDVLRWAEEVS